MSADNKKVVSNENLAAFAEALAAKVPLKSDIPTKVSDLQNDLGFTDKQGTITSVTLNGTTTSSGGVDLGYLVVQEGGKGLSSNDYTALEKNKLGGIDTGAQVNTIETVKVNGTALIPDANKAVDVQVPTTVAELSDSSDYAKTSDLEDYVLITDLEDTEEVLAAAVNDLNDRISGLVDQYPTEGSENAVSSGGVYEVITENEQIISSSLSSLDSRITDLEEAAESAPGLDQVPTENSTNAVSSGGVYNVITQNELISAAAINELNTRVSDVEEGLDNIVIPTKVSDLQNDSGFTSNTGTLTGVSFNGVDASVTNGVASITATIPAAVTESTVSGWGFTKNAGTLTGVSFNGASATVSNGVASISANVPLIIDVGENPTSAPSGTFTQCQSAILANKVVALMVTDEEDSNKYLYIHQNTGTYYGGHFVDIRFYRVGENYIYWYTLSPDNSLTYARKQIGTLTGVKFNNVDATVSNGVASITATIPDVANYFDEVSYDSQTKRINFKHGETVKKYIDATDFIKDGMVDSVEIATPESGTNAGVSCLVVTFNTDAGKEDIEIPLSSIFNPTNYYTKTETDGTFVKKADIDSAPTENSSNPVSSGGVYTTIAQSEYVISTSLNDLNTRVSDVEDGLGNIVIPNVPNWALATTKPNYTLDEVLDGTTRYLQDKTSINMGSSPYLEIAVTDTCILKLILQLSYDEVDGEESYHGYVSCMYELAISIISSEDWIVSGSILSGGNFLQEYSYQYGGQQRDPILCSYNNGALTVQLALDRELVSYAQNIQTTADIAVVLGKTSLSCTATSSPIGRNGAQWNNLNNVITDIETENNSLKLKQGCYWFNQIPYSSIVTGGGGLTGVSFNGSPATVTNGVASITATIPTIESLTTVEIDTIWNSAT